MCDIKVSLFLCPPLVISSVHLTRRDILYCCHPFPVAVISKHLHQLLLPSSGHVVQTDFFSRRPSAGSLLIPYKLLQIILDVFVVILLKRLRYHLDLFLV